MSSQWEWSVSDLNYTRITVLEVPSWNFRFLKDEDAKRRIIRYVSVDLAFRHSYLEMLLRLMQNSWVMVDWVARCASSCVGVCNLCFALIRESEKFNLGNCTKYWMNVQKETKQHTILETSGIFDFVSFWNFLVYYVIISKKYSLTLQFCAALLVQNYYFLNHEEQQAKNTFENRFSIPLRFI